MSIKERSVKPLHAINNKNKGQVSIFIILGLVLLIALFILFLFQGVDDDQKTTLQSGKINEEDIISLTNFVETCLHSGSEPVIKELIKKGGTFTPKETVIHEGIPVTVLASYESLFGYDVHPLTIPGMEGELSARIVERVEDCANLDLYGQFGYTIEKGKTKLNVTINKEDVSLFLHFPITMKRGEATATVTEFSQRVSVPLRFIYGVALDILNQESAKGYFDKDLFGLQRNIIIKKEKPHPHTIYTIILPEEEGENTTFTFALKGLDTVAKEALVFGQKGCCRDNINNVCIKNVDKNECDSPLEHDRPFDCSCPENTQPIITGCCEKNGKCASTSKDGCDGLFTEGDPLCKTTRCENLDCKQTYNYAENDFSNPRRKHGETWCSYESMVGNGLDYVGGRHYLHSCINGEEFVEPCRDFREELCTQKNEFTVNGEFSTARCRVNRWQDCHAQDDESSCEDTTKRDCYWAGYLSSQKKCFPNVPPGLKFWEREGQQICDTASLNKDAIGFDSPRSWGHSTLLYCQSSGDCGNYRNIADAITEYGYYNPDGLPERWVYFDDGFHKRGDEFEIRLPLDATPIPVGPHLSSGGSGGFASCNLWQPGFDSCEFCHRSSLHHCTEYKCKSLGSGCNFNEETKTCSSFGTNFGKPRITTFEVRSPYTYKTQSSIYYKGGVRYHVSPSVPVHEPLKMSFTTSEPTRCQISLVPPEVDPSAVRSMGLAYSEILLNRQDYKQDYEIEMRFPSTNFTDISRYLLFLRCINKAGGQNDEAIIHITTQELHSPFTVPEILLARPVTRETKRGQTNQFSFFTSRPFKECRYASTNIPWEAMTNLSCSTEEENVVYQYDTPLGSFPCYEGVDIPSTAVQMYFLCEGYNGNRGAPYVFSIFT